MYKHTPGSQLKTASWAGGTTTQLTIRPLSAEYQKFNFDYRISFATVEVEESTFTFMPGVTRHLMILEGELIIDHIDRYQKQLGKFDIDTFNGEWPTKAKGKVRDFNLMTRGNFKGNLKSQIINSGTKVELKPDGLFMGIFIVKGHVNILYNSESVTLSENDFFELENEMGVIYISSVHGAECVIAEVR